MTIKKAPKTQIFEKQLLNNETTVLLIKEELKSRKLSSLLHDLGVEHCVWLPSVNDPIAESLGLKTDEDFRQYDKLMDEYVKQMKDTSDLRPIANELLSKFSNINPHEVHAHA